MMIGRAAIGYPWIFNEINIASAGEHLAKPTTADRVESSEITTWSMVGRVNALECRNASIITPIISKELQILKNTD
jgi:tRNA-dihydrouridine synthase